MVYIGNTIYVPLFTKVGQFVPYIEYKKLQMTFFKCSCNISHVFMYPGIVQSDLLKYDVHHFSCFHYNTTKHIRLLFQFYATLKLETNVYLEKFNISIQVHHIKKKISKLDLSSGITYRESDITKLHPYNTLQISHVPAEQASLLFKTFIFHGDDNLVQNSPLHILDIHDTQLYRTFSAWGK